MGLRNLIMATKFGFRDFMNHPLTMSLGRRTWRSGIQGTSGTLRTERYFQGRNSHIEGWAPDWTGNLAVRENIKIKRNPNSIHSVYQNEHYYVRTADSELAKAANGETSIINREVVASSYKPYEKNVCTKQTVHTNGTYSNYEMCYNPETGMDEFVRIGGGVAKNVSVAPRFDAIKGVEMFEFKGL